MNSERKFRLFNATNEPVAIADDVIPAAAWSLRVYTQEEISAIASALAGRNVFPFDSTTFQRHMKRPAWPMPNPAPVDKVKRTACRGRGSPRPEDAAPATDIPKVVPARWVIPGRLLIVERKDFKDEILPPVAVVINLGLPLLRDDLHAEKIVMNWNCAADVAAPTFQAVIRFIVAAMRVNKQPVLLCGDRDAVAVLTACAFREYLGCDAVDAIEALRRIWPTCLTRSELLETVFNYRISST